MKERSEMKIVLLTVATLISLVLICGCNSSNSAVGENPDTNDTIKLELDWQTLSDTTKYSVDYIQLNFGKYPTGETMGKDIFDLQNDRNGKKMKLTNTQEFALFELVTDTSNFSEGDCGTFHLNAGFIIYEEGKSTGKINVGCGYNQWNFEPYNPHSKYGGLSDKGFGEMEKLLDDINLTNK